MSTTTNIVGLIVVLLSIGIYQFHSKYLAIVPCNNDPPIVLSEERGDSTSTKFDSCSIFSLEYDEAREKFRTMAQKHKDVTNIMTFPIVDDSMTMDVAILKGERSGVIFHSSATHGVEGYSGSAVQLAMLQSDGLLPPPSDRPTIVLIHSINPYGMKHYRRYNENNVDLNRNGIVNMEEFIKDREPNVAGYDDFRNLLSPQRSPSYWEATIGWWLNICIPFVKHGYLALKRVMVSGQYHHPKGIFYGGTEVQTSIKVLETMIDQIFELLGQEERNVIAWLDVHTGLGKSGKDTLMIQKDFPIETLKEAFPDAESIMTPKVEDKAALAGYDLTKGTVIEYILEKYGTEQTIVSMQEFGTIPGILVGRSMILENMTYQFGGNKEWARRWAQVAFYPQTTQWRRSIIQRGVLAMVQMIEFVNDPPKKEVAASSSQES